MQKESDVKRFLVEEVSEVNIWLMQPVFEKGIWCEKDSVHKRYGPKGCFIGDMSTQSSSKYMGR